MGGGGRHQTAVSSRRLPTAPTQRYAHVACPVYSRHTQSASGAASRGHPCRQPNKQTNRPAGTQTNSHTHILGYIGTRPSRDP
eukprot:237172-Prymnesium_polylepis.1